MRNSSFELLRLIAQYMIVVYHILLFWFINNGASANIVLHKSICIPLHIGVILYVLISGYFGIHFSLKGVIKIISNLFVYGLLFALVAHFCFGDKFGPTKLFFVSASPFWFINIYLMLYCISPILNKIIKGLSKSNRLVLMLILFWISCYVGLLGFDDSLQYGKNLIHFVLLYIIGNTLAVCKHKINSIPLIYILLAYILINFISISLYVSMVGNSYEYLAYDMAFSYNSPLLIANAICVFVPFMRFKFHNKIINTLASSCLAIYLIHSANLFMQHPIKHAAMFIQFYTDSILGQLCLVLLLGLVVCIVAILLDNLLKPIWRKMTHLYNCLSRTKVGKIACDWCNLG